MRSIKRNIINIAQSGWWSLQFSYHASKITTIATVLITLIVGFVPSSQVFLVRKLAESTEVSDRNSAIFWAIATGVVIAGYLAAQQVMYTLMRMTQVSATAVARAAMSDTYSRLTPAEILSESIQANARAAREAVIEKKVSLQATSVLSLVLSVIVVLSLTFAIGRDSLSAALLIVGVLLPLSLAAMYYAKKDQLAWPRIAEARRLSAYREDQLTYSSRALELACMDARGRVAESAKHFQKISCDQELWLERQGIKADSLAGLASVGLLVLALLSLVLSGANGPTVISGTVGILSGIMATANMGYTIGSLMSGANAIRRYRDFVELETNDEPASPFAEEIQKIEVVDLTVRYSGANRTAVAGASICAQRGEIIALVGANGAGKSTLVNAIVGLAPIESGKIYFNDRDVTKGGFLERHGAISIMSQDFGRYEFTVRENLELSGTCLADNPARLQSALKSSRAEDIVAQLPDGLESKLGEQWGGVGLSGGQWQRIALARMELRNASLWILDEPTSAIDAEAEEEIFRELRARCHDRITIIVSHRAWTLQYADRIYVLDDGKIVEQGSYPQLISGKGRFAALFRSQEQKA